nr:hypothetical protein [Oceaniglobus ichthyenteri]
MKQDRVLTLDQILNALHLVFLGLDNLDAILSHQSAHVPLPNLIPQFLQFFGHARLTIALQAHAALCADIRQDHHITAVPAAHWAVSPPAKSSQCDLRDAAEKLHRPNFFSSIGKSKAHRLWPAEKLLGTLLCNALPVSVSPPFFHFPVLAKQADFFAKALVLLLNIIVRTRHQIIMLPLGPVLRNALPGNGCF